MGECTFGYYVSACHGVFRCMRMHSRYTGKALHIQYSMSEEFAYGILARRSRHAKRKASPDPTHNTSVAATAALPIFFDFLAYIDPHHEPVEEQHERIDIKVRVFTPATLLHRSAVVGISPPDWHRPAQDLHLHLATVEAAVGA